MLKSIVLVFLLFLICTVAFPVYAGKVELTTYYPAPYGEYKNLKSTEGAAFATSSGNVGIGTANPQAKLDVAGSVKIADGTQGARKVLTSDANGSASWQTGNGDYVPLDVLVGNILDTQTSVANLGLPSAPTIPDTAKEILVYVDMMSGSCSGQNGTAIYKIYTTNNGKNYVHKFKASKYLQNAETVNSDNFWLPFNPNDRNIRVVIDTANSAAAFYSGACLNYGGTVQVLGYR